MKLSVIIPAYNEGRTLRTIVEKVRVVPVNKEIIIVNDASNDNSERVLSEIGKEFADIKILHHKRNRGKGAAIRSGLEHVSGEIVIVQDADLELDPSEYPTLIKPIEDGLASVVYGSRELGKQLKEHHYFLFYLGGKSVTWFANLLYGSHLTDAPTGYKVLRTEVIKSLNLECERFDFDPEVTAKVLKRGIKIIEVPISYKPRTITEGKKINWRDGIMALWTLLKYKMMK
ncbi:MAG: glycosyltransferase family 2 protein [Ignavibacteriales bacterium]|nr:glycosyltransferase family 2 protein [Ignavibacteriales bacterium]